MILNLPKLKNTSYYHPYLLEYDAGSEEVFNDGTTVKKLLQSMINYNDVPKFRKFNK